MLTLVIWTECIIVMRFIKYTERNFNHINIQQQKPTNWLLETW